MFKGILFTLARPLITAAIAAAKHALVAALDRAIDSARSIPEGSRAEVKALVQSAVESWHVAL